MRTAAARTAALLGWVVVLALCAAVPARAADPFYGMLTTDLDTPGAQVDAALRAQAATGVGLLREHVYWDQIERAPGRFDFTRLDELVTRAARRGMTVLPILTSTPPFYSTRPKGLSSDGWPPRDPASIERFTFALAHRYGAHGTFWSCPVGAPICLRPYRPIRAWQVWNEPDIPAWWRTGPNPVAYLRLLRYADAGLKAGDPSSEVVLAGLSLASLPRDGFLGRLYALGAAPYFDTLAIHPYGPSVAAVVAHVQRVRRIAADNGDGRVPIRATEYGFATGGRSAWTTTVPCQAALIAATTRVLAARRRDLGLRSIVQLQWQDRAGTPSPWPNHAGLLFADGSAKPALASFARAVRGRAARPGSAVADVCGPQHQG
jgi:hypothetical protein